MVCRFPKRTTETTRGKKITSRIINEPKIKNAFVVKIRELLEHRAFWLYLLVDEAEKRGLDPRDLPLQPSPAAASRRVTTL